MEILFLIGRIIFGGFFLMNALNHFTKTAMLTGYAASKNVPSPRLAVLATGVLLTLGGLGMLLGTYVEWAVLALALFFISVNFKVHDYWRDTDPNTKMMNKINFNKNLALLGAALMVLAIPQPWPFSL